MKKDNCTSKWYPMIKDNEKEKIHHLWNKWSMIKGIMLYYNAKHGH